MILQLKKWLIKKQLSNRKILEHNPLSIEGKHKEAQALFNDSSYFNGIDSAGNFFLCRMSFRHQRSNEHWLEFYSPKHGLLRRIDPLGEEGPGFQQGNLKFEMIEPLKKWKVYYEGEMSSAQNVHQVRIELVFDARTPMVDFQGAMILEATAEAIAKEAWSSSFFSQLKEIKKMHFEQGGSLKGTISIDGQSSQYNFHSMRDHSWGTRKWEDWNRHCWISGMLDNGDCINFSMIKYQFMGQLAAGFYIKDDQVSFLREYPNLDSFASEPLFPQKGSVALVFENNIKVQLNWTRQQFVPYLMDKDSYHIYEGISNGNVGDNKAFLVTEFGFNPREYAFNF
jgi:hypothetical protein